MATIKKQQSLTELSEKLDKSKSIAFADYRGLTHKQLEDLRRNLKKVNAEFIVAKNTLIKIALSQNDKLKTHTDSLKGILENPTAILFSFGDEVLPLKEIAKFVKNFQLPTIKAGIFGGQNIPGNRVLEIAKLPSREVLLAQVVGTINSPIQGLHAVLHGNLRKLVVVLNQINSKKQ